MLMIADDRLIYGLVRLGSSANGHGSFSNLSLHGFRLLLTANDLFPLLRLHLTNSLLLFFSMVIVATDRLGVATERRFIFVFFVFNNQLAA